MSAELKKRGPGSKEFLLKVISFYHLALKKRAKKNRGLSISKIVASEFDLHVNRVNYLVFHRGKEIYRALKDKEAGLGLPKRISLLRDLEELERINEEGKQT